MLTTLTDGLQITQNIVFETIVCYKCGVPFAVSAKHRAQLRESHDTFYCPAGHPQHYTGDNTEERLKRQLDEQKRLAERQQQELTDKLLDAINAKNKLDKQVKRMHKGLCPCCNRTFTNLANHIKTQHPDLVGKEKCIYKLPRQPRGKTT